MALQVEGIIYDSLSADPGSPVEGQAWFNSTTFLYKIFRNGAVTSFTDKVSFDAHATSTSNPHTTTLEQARTAGATLSGAINMGGFAITNIATGSAGTDTAQRQWVTDQINQKVRGLDWQNSVLSSIASPPGSPTTGDRYRVIATGTGAWVGKENQLAEWNGTSWDFAIPNEGFATRDESTNLLLIFDGTAWGSLGGAISHATLLNLSADDHTQYLLTSGSRAMGGALNMGGFAIGTVGTVDGVTVSAHAARHQPGGADALTTAAPVAIGTANAAGSATSLVRSDHVHAHGNQTVSTLHGLSSASGAGFQPQSNYAATTNPGVSNDNTAGYVIGSLWINTTLNTTWVATSVATGAAVWKELTNIAGVLTTKAGKVLAASFAGTPKKATVTFATVFTSAAYAITLTPIIATSGTLYTPNVESQVAGSFVINMGSSTIGSLTAVSWIAVFGGESA